MTDTTIGVTQVATVMLPVADQDAAVEWYVGVLGFEKRFDSPFGNGDRWVEVAPPGGQAGLALIAGQEGLAPGTVALLADDVDAEHARLRERGATDDAEVMRMPPPVPPMFRVQDPDGNNLWIVGRP